MKNLQLLALCLVISTSAFTQEFAKLGAHWKYTGWQEMGGNIQPDCESSDCADERIQLSSVDTFSMFGMTCSKIQLGETFVNDPSLPNFTVCSDSGRYYFLDNDSLYLFLDFNLEVGDTLMHYSPRNMGFTILTLGSWNSLPDSIRVIEGRSLVVSKELVNVNGVDLFRMGFDSNSSLNGADYPLIRNAIEGIGNTGAFFGERNVALADGCSGMFWCFEDELISYHAFPGCTECDFPDVISATYDLWVEHELIAPNITANYVFINETVLEEITEIYVFDVSGKMVYKPIIGSNRIDFTSLRPGMYFVVFEQGNRRKSVRVVKL